MILPLRSAGVELLPRGHCSVPGRLSCRGDPSQRQPPGPGNSQQARKSEAGSGPCPGGHRGPDGSRHPTYFFSPGARSIADPPGPLHHLSRKQDYSGSSPPPPPTPPSALPSTSVRNPIVQRYERQMSKHLASSLKRGQQGIVTT